MNTSALSLEVRRYSSYLEYAPAPQGFQSTRIPTNINQWQHFQGSGKIHIKLHQQGFDEGLVQLVVDAQVVEQIAWKRRESLSQIAQYSAKYPAVLCKYLIQLQGKVFMKRFQIGFYSVGDFERCCEALRSQGFHIKMAPMFHASQFSQSFEETIMSSQYADDKTYSTPPDSQIVSTRAIQNEKRLPPLNVQSKDDFNSQFAGVYNISPSCTGLDTQSFSQTMNDPLIQELNDFEVQVANYQLPAILHENKAKQPKLSANFENGFVHQNSLAKSTSVNVCSDEVGKKPLQIEMNADDPVRCLNSATNVNESYAVSAYTAPEIEQEKSKVDEVTVPDLDISVAATDVSFKAADKSPLCIEHGKLQDFASKDKAPSYPVSFTSPKTQSYGEFTQVESILTHPLEGLCQNRRSGLSEQSEETNTAKRRTKISPDIISEKLKDVAFTTWVCSEKSIY
ncbi:LAFA_0F11276g1_1 [Lachancea sp. 'fantastica']|nr:LAFA_0F11276g1_1 [Lachancea sp. 'fantastica']